MTLVVDQAYQNLLAEVQGQILAGRERVQKLVEQETVRLYWEVGGPVGEYLDSVDRSHGQQVISRLARDVQMSTQILYDAIRFRTLFPNFPTWGNLTWSHFRRVLPVLTEEGRMFYLSTASTEGWSVRELMARIKDNTFERSIGLSMESVPDTQVVQQRLMAKRGEPYVYRVTEKWGQQVLDLGFHSYHPLPKSQTYETGNIVRSVPDGRFDSGYRIESAELRARIYAFRATVSRIIDGDTLWATIDLGFNHWTDVKLRLRGIDAEELGTPGGLSAKDYLTGVLSDAGDFVVTTTRVDVYDRYLADLFVLPGESGLALVASKGLYVNRQMILDGVARLWTKTKPPEF